jgi:hypothetical protein
MKNNEGMEPRFLDFDTSYKWLVSFTPRPLYPRGSSPLYSLDRRLGWFWNRSGRRGRNKIFSPTGIRTPTSLLSSLSSVAKADCAIRAHMSNV